MCLNWYYNCKRKPIMYLCHIFVFLVATSIYSNSLSGDFVHDDIVAIVRNPDVNLARSVKIGLSSFSNKGENWDRWWSLWKNDYWGMPMSSPLSHKSYRPLTVLTFRLNYYLSDNSLCPEIFHGTNIIIHGLVTSLTLHLCKSVLKMRFRAAVLTSLIFALHPIHTEAVAGITGRADALACLLMLVSFLLYHKLLSLPSPENYSLLKPQIECQNQPKMRESEKCYCKSNSVQSNFVTVKTGSESNANTEFVPNFLDLNDNEYLKCNRESLPSSTYIFSKPNAILFTSGLLGCAAMLAKETGITVLGINLLYDLYLHLHLFGSSSTQGKTNSEENQVTKNKPHLSYLHYESANKQFSRCNQKNLRKRLLFLLLLILLSLSIRFALMNGELPKFGLPDNPTAYSQSKLTRLLTYAYLPVINFLLILYPRTLSYDWQMGSIPLVETIWDSRNFATVAFYTTLFFLVRRDLYSKQYKKGNTVLAVALLFIVIPYLPASNLLFSVGFVVAERVLYIPSLGISILIVYGLDSLYQTFQTKLDAQPIFQILFKLCVGVCTCSLLVTFGLRTWQRSAVWQSRLTLFTSGLQDIPHNAKMHYNYANLQKDMGQSIKAIEHYTIAIKLWHEYASAHNNLGTLLMGNPAAAEHHFLRAIEAGNQAHGGAHFNLGFLYMQSKKYFEAASHFKKSLLIDPSHREASEYLSFCYSLIYSQTEGKSKNESNASRNSTGDPVSATTADQLEFSIKREKSTELLDVVSQTTEVGTEHEKLTNIMSSKFCTQNSSTIHYPKQFEQLDVFERMIGITNSFHNSRVKPLKMQ